MNKTVSNDKSCSQLKVWLIRLVLPVGIFVTLPKLAGAQAIQQVDQAQNIPLFHQPQVEITPYVWGLQINSDDQIGNQSLNAELPLDRILKNLTGLAELEVVPRYKNFFLVGDGIYASLDPNPKTPIPGVDHINLQAGLVTVGGGYSFGPVKLNRDSDKPIYVSFQPFVGAAYTDIDVTARSATPSTVAHAAQEWWMPVIGGRIDAQRGSLLARLDGDFSTFDSSQREEQVLGAVGYQFHKKKLGFPSLNLGYRYLYEQKADGSAAVLRLKLQGPLVFATFHF